ncbi:hypothetical protein KF728_27980 [Candidatus Obscuribacterales bacterium]|nr:hypothetical protein [Candidatus Obscuribacterales bacterium]
MLFRYFFILSIVCLLLSPPAFCLNALPGDVVEIGNSVLELEHAGQSEAAVERMKDAICLADLREVPTSDQVAFLLKIGKIEDGSLSDNPVLSSRQTTLLRNYCDAQILQKINIKSAADMELVVTIWKRLAEHPSGAARRLTSEVVAFQANSNEEKRAKARALVVLSEEADYSHSHNLKQLASALDIAQSMQPAELSLQKEALTKMVSSLVKVRDGDDLKLVRRAVETTLSIYDSGDCPDVEGAINVLVEKGDLASLSSICEQQERIYRKALNVEPQVFVPDMLYTGWAYLEAGRRDVAKRKFDEVVQLTKERPECESLYECAQVSRAHAGILDGEVADAEHRLLDVVEFLDSPTRADLCHYGAIAYALLGQIHENKGSLETARGYYEKADEGLMSGEQLGPSEYIGFIGVKKRLPNDAFVLQRLKVIYEKLGMTEKVKLTEKNLASEKKALETRNLTERVDASRKIYSSVYFPSEEVLQALEPYVRDLESTKTREQLGPYLNRAATALIFRGMPSRAKFLLERTDSLDLDPAFKVIVKRNMAWIEGLQGHHEESARMLNQLIESKANSADEVCVVRWLLARNLIAQDKWVEAAQMLRLLTSNWRPGSERGKYFLEAICDQASLLIRKKKYSTAEVLLKQYLSQPTNPNDDYSPVDVNFVNYPTVLLAIALAAEGKREEATYHYARASKPDRNHAPYGVHAAKTANSLADAALLLGDRARARRFYFEAFNAYNDMEGFASEAKDCKASCDALL